MSEFNFEIHVGVKQLRINWNAPCREFPKKQSCLELSFVLTGDFGDAGIHDRLSHTIDYDALSSKIAHALMIEHCADNSAVNNAIRKTILNFSPLITGGYYFYTTPCHNAFTVNKRLL